MIRTLHRWPGLLAVALLTVLAVSGAALSFFPAAERLTAPQAAAELDIAELASRIQAAYPGVEQIRRAPSGRITAYWFDGGRPGSAVIDPDTGQGIATADPNVAERWLTKLHRSLFLDDGGRLVMAAGAAVMLVLAYSGALLVARRTGGWWHWFAPLRGELAGRLHVELARVAVFGLALSAATALWMTASTFGLVPDTPAAPAFPAEVSGQTGAEFARMDALASTPASELRELNFPFPGDLTDAFALTTNKGTGYIDQGTGELLAWAEPTAWQRISEMIYMLHTGQGAEPLGLMLGILALAVPALGGTGLAFWRARRRGQPRIRNNQPPGRAETIILVGSEGGSTWGFAATLQMALAEAGQRVHATPMAAFDPARYVRAKRILILAATYGNGTAPASAKGFVTRLARLKTAPAAPVAVLGFGDRNFPEFCAFAQTVSDQADTIGWPQFLPLDTVDRQSPQDFARWGRALGEVLGLELDLLHQPVPPATEELTLVSRRDYGDEVQAPTAILRFALPRAALWRRLTGSGFARFEAGDLIGIVPEGSAVPRFYSLSSANRDGFVEIVVKKQPGGLCSGQLVALEPGRRIHAFLRRNPAFHVGRGRSPVVLIGAGTGVGPLAGIVRANRTRRPVHLFFGLRHPHSDFLYGEELTAWRADGRLARLVTATSRTARPHYVQDAMREEASEVAGLVRDGARVMVCGGRQMAAGVASVMTEILAPLGLTLAALKAEGRYVEDVY